MAGMIVGRGPQRIGHAYNLTRRGCAARMGGRPLRAAATRTGYDTAFTRSRIIRVTSPPSARPLVSRIT
jgi:hypothetical protein